ncbi:MAG: hypothetical protein F9B45_03150 [Phycisphaera sp. RhM]|nr:hypothetical protein [Phycisphaera sp. RhM]
MLSQTVLQIDDDAAKIWKSLNGIPEMPFADPADFLASTRLAITKTPRIDSVHRIPDQYDFPAPGTVIPRGVLSPA